MKRALAVHEAGKALVATLLRARSGFLERVERVSMVPRGQCAPPPPPPPQFCCKSDVVPARMSHILIAHLRSVS